MNDNPTSLRGVRLKQLESNGVPLLSRLYRQAIIGAVNALCNLKVVAPRGDGTQLEADVKITDMGMVITLPTGYGGGGGGNGGGYDGTYDNTQSYVAGQIVRVTTTTTIAGVTVVAGLYAVPPGVVVPANGTGFQVPQYPEPVTFTSVPNDKCYWNCLAQYC